MDQEQRQGKKGKGEPNVEVEGQVLEVKVPRLGTIEIRTTGRRENVVLDNIPAYYNRLLVEEEVDGEVEELCHVSPILPY